ncbi:MAG: hypothetical protein IKS71_00630 [Bacteroidales bacterium]|nr:hypothetical protein [Bacteroidales bacterium]
MAKIYSSRVMLDPQLISLANNALYNRIRDDREARKGLFDSFSNLGNTMGKFGDTMYERYLQGKRRDSVMGSATADQSKDPVFIAAVDEYARTGSSSPLSTYQLGVNTAAERKASTDRAAQERKDREDREADIKLLNAKDKYSATLKEMLDYDNPESDKYSPTMANVKAQELKSLEDQFGADAFATLAKDARAAAVLERQERAAKKKLESDEKARADAAAAAKKKEDEETENERLYRIAQFKSGLPMTFANADEKLKVVEQIKANGDMTIKEKTDYLNDIFGTQTTSEKIQAAAVDNKIKHSNEDADEQHKKQKADRAVLEKARKKIKAGKRNRLTTKEIEALKAVGEF